MLMEKEIVNGGNCEKNPLPLEIKKLALKGWKKENNEKSKSIEWMILQT